MDEYQNHTQAEFLTDSARIARLERQVAELLTRVARLNGQFIDIRATQPKEISAAVNEAVDVIDVAMADLRQRVEDRLSEFTRRLNEAERRLTALEASDKQTVRHGMDNDTDLADIRRRLAALERQQPPDLNAEQVAHLVGLGGGIAWGGLE